jgi:hypothetical protein
VAAGARDAAANKQHDSSETATQEDR